jgi:aminoglycoside phosphotransferase (APT) family kinase protein
VPAFVTQAVEKILAEEPPPADRMVLSHGDVNPTNLVFDGERLLLVDWEIAGANDPYYDLAAASVFLRFDDRARDELLDTYGLPRSARFDYDRRVVAIGCGVVFLHLARMAGHEGRATGISLPLADFYHRLSVGAFSLGTGDGRWAFGLALIGEVI